MLVVVWSWEHLALYSNELYHSYYPEGVSIYSYSIIWYIYVYMIELRGKIVLMIKRISTHLVLS